MATRSNTFVYGTLMADEVLTLLIKRVPKWQHAQLQGFKRFGVRGQVYPAIIRSEDSDAVVSGKVLMELSPHEMHVLDTYEAEEYERISVKPILEDSTSVEADVYIFRDQFKTMLMPTGWDYSAWRQQHLGRWVKRLSPSGAHPDGLLDD